MTNETILLLVVPRKWGKFLEIVGTRRRTWLNCDEDKAAPDDRPNMVVGSRGSLQSSTRPSEM